MRSTSNTTAEIEKIAPYSFDDLDPGIRELSEIISNKVIARLGRAIHGAQSRGPRYVPVYMQGKIKDGRGSRSFFLEAPHVVYPERPFAFILRSYKNSDQYKTPCSVVPTACGVAPPNCPKKIYPDTSENTVAFSDNTLRKAQSSVPVLPVFDLDAVVSTVIEIISDNGENGYFGARAGSRNTAVKRLFTPKEGSIRERYLLFVNGDFKRPTHQATLERTIA